MTKRITKSSASTRESWAGKHRFEHWYVDKQVYFITARCRNRYPAFSTTAAQDIFWNRLTCYAARFRFDPWIVSLMSNHYHLLGYCREGKTLGKMMQLVHGSVAKLVNDLLPERRLPFWTERGPGHADYFDGCIRDEKQFVRAYRYTLAQDVHHRVARDCVSYSGTRVFLDMDEGLVRAVSLKAFLKGVPYPRYNRRPRR